MTVLVGARCADGVVIGADSIATSAAGPHHLISIRSEDKIKIIGGQIIVAGTGSVGLGQRFVHLVQEYWGPKGFQKSCNDCIKEIAARAVQDFGSTGTPRTPQSGFGFGAMMAAAIGNKHELIEFGALDLQPERKTSVLHFVTMGSGQILADPFIAFISRVLWGGKEPDVKSALLGVCWALEHTIKYAPGGVGEPIQLAVLRREGGGWKARLVPEDETLEKRQHIAEIERQIGNYARSVVTDGPVVPLPTPPPSAPGG